MRFDRSVEWSNGRTELAADRRGSHPVRAGPLSDIDGRELRFFYTVRAEDRAGDGVSIPGNALSLDAGTIADRAGTTFTNTPNEPVPADARSKVDGSRVTAPRISNLIYHSPSRGHTYRATTASR